MTNREFQEEVARAVREAEGFCAAAVNPAPHPNAHKYLPELRAARIVFGGFVAAAESEEDINLCDRFRMLLSELDKLENDLKGRE